MREYTAQFRELIERSSTSTEIRYTLMSPRDQFGVLQVYSLTLQAHHEAADVLQLSAGFHGQPMPLERLECVDGALPLLCRFEKCMAQMFAEFDAAARGSIATESHELPAGPLLEKVSTRLEVFRPEVTGLPSSNSVPLSQQQVFGIFVQFLEEVQLAIRFACRATAFDARLFQPSQQLLQCFPTYPTILLERHLQQLMTDLRGSVLLQEASKAGLIHSGEDICRLFLQEQAAQPKKRICL